MSGLPQTRGVKPYFTRCVTTGRDSWRWVRNGRVGKPSNTLTKSRLSGTCCLHNKSDTASRTSLLTSRISHGALLADFCVRSLAKCSTGPLRGRVGCGSERFQKSKLTARGSRLTLRLLTCPGGPAESVSHFSFPLVNTHVVPMNTMAEPASTTLSDSQRRIPLKTEHEI